MATDTSSVAAAFQQGLTLRRSIYALSHGVDISQADIEELCRQVVYHVPTAFNSQRVRVLLLVGPAHWKLWDMASQNTRENFPEAALPRLLGRIEGFKAAYGTACFFQDSSIDAKTREDNPFVAHLVDEWAAHAQGMHHFALWTMLEARGLGANLQHYSQLGQAMIEEWALPSDWIAHAQLVFGKATAPPRERARTIRSRERGC